MTLPDRSHERKRIGDCLSGGEHPGPVLQSMQMVQETEDALRCAQSGAMLPLSLDRPRLHSGSY